MSLLAKMSRALSFIVTRMSSRRCLFAHTARDAVPALMGLGHMAVLAKIFFGFHAMP